MTPDVVAAVEMLRETLESLAHHAISAAVREVTKTDLLPALARVAQALADGAEGARLHEELYAAAVAENERIRAGWNAAEQALEEYMRHAARSVGTCCAQADGDGTCLHDRARAATALDGGAP